VGPGVERVRLEAMSKFIDSQLVRPASCPRPGGGEVRAGWEENGVYYGWLFSIVRVTNKQEGDARVREKGA